MHHSTVRRRALRATAATAALTVGLTACGTDVPSGPMDEAELETVFLTGTAVPEGWDLHGSPQARDRFGEPFDEVGPIGGAGGDAAEECQEARDDAEEQIEGVEYVAEATASYGSDGAGVEIQAISTDEELDVSGIMQDLLGACESELQDEISGSTGLDADDFDVRSPGTNADGLSFIHDGADGGTLVMVMESYGNNHFVASAFSDDPRDVEDIEEFVDAAQERFEEGPEATDPDD